jgi:hypothetical protein
VASGRPSATRTAAVSASISSCGEESSTPPPNGQRLPGPLSRTQRNHRNGILAAAGLNLNQAAAAGSLPRTHGHGERVGAIRASAGRSRLTAASTPCIARARRSRSRRVLPCPPAPDAYAGHAPASQPAHGTPRLHPRRQNIALDGSFHGA